MPYSSLRDFMTRLEAEGRLTRVTEPISPYLEMTEIQTRLLAEGGPAVLFEHPIRPDGTPYDIPVLVNLFGTIERVAWGMDREPSELRAVGETLAFLRQPEPPGSLREAMGMLPLAKTVLAMRPKTVGHAPCQESFLNPCAHRNIPDDHFKQFSVLLGKRTDCRFNGKDRTILFLVIPVPEMPVRRFQGQLRFIRFGGDIPETEFQHLRRTVSIKA